MQIGFWNVYLPMPPSASLHGLSLLGRAADPPFTPALHGTLLMFQVSIPAPPPLRTYTNRMNSFLLGNLIKPCATSCITRTTLYCV